MKHEADEVMDTCVRVCRDGEHVQVLITTARKGHVLTMGRPEAAHLADALRRELVDGLS